MTYPWWKIKKCDLCKGHIKKNQETASLRIGSAEGLHEIEICLTCADFWDKSAEVLQTKKTPEKTEENE